MPSSHKRREREIFEVALALGPEERDSFLADACGGDAALRSRVEDRLSTHAGSDPLTVEAAARAEPRTDASRAPVRIGPYRVLEQIGEGGMGTVYVAEQTEPVRRRVAIKVVKPGMGSKQVLARFESERQALALMNHPNVARILDVGTTEHSLPYFVMEYVPGLAITEYCDGKQLGLGERLELFLEVCSAIDHAHQRGVIHRDIKPSNILVTEDVGRPVVKVIDFGIAKATGQRLSDLTVHTRLGTLIGTPEYMSPEQAELSALDVDTRTDVYSLGAVLYELLVGVPPLGFGDDQSLTEIQRIIAEEDPPPPSVRLAQMASAAVGTVLRRGGDSDGLRRALRGDLDWITMKALEKDRNRRYSFPSELAADLRRHLEDLPVLAGPPSTGYRLRKFVRRHRGAVLGAGLVLALVAVGLWGLWGWSRTLRTAELAQRFGRDVASLEWQLRVAQMTPLHDLTEEHRRIEASLGEIEAEMRRLGRVARAPGEYALGRGELALGHEEEAAAHLEKAWMDDLRTPEVAFARGVALGQIYRREYARARAIRDPERRAAEVAEVQRRYRDPALEALGEARSTAAAPLAYVEALIALHEERYDEAFELIDAALEKAPWLWEALKLEGDALSNLGAQLHRENRREEGRARLLAADRAYAAAIALAPSAAEAYFGRCSNGNYRLFQSLNEGVSEEQFMGLRAEVERSCGNLEAVLPEHPELPVNLANIHMMSAWRLVAQGKDPRPEAEQAGRLARTALERTPGSASALRALGDSLLTVGRYGWERGDDTRDLLSAAGATFERAAEIERSPAAANNGANAYLLKARLELTRGADPSESLAKAEELYRRALELSPTDVLTQGNLTLVARDRASWDAAHGRDPLPRLRQAATLLEEQIAKAPEIAFLHVSMTGLAAELAEAEARWGDEDPHPWLERGRRAAARASELAPGTHGPYWSLALVEAEAARELAVAGRDAGPAVAAAGEALDLYQQLFSGQAKAHRLRGRVYLYLARSQWARRVDPSASIGAGLAELDRALELQPSEEREVLPILAQLRALELEAAAGDAAARRVLVDAVEVARRLEETSGDQAASLLAAARLREWESRLAADPHRRREAEERARRLEARAVAINPALAKRPPGELVL